MKKIVFIAIAAIAITTAAKAQDSSMSREKMKGEQATKMHRGDAMDELNLTAAQKDKMKKMREDSRTKMETIRNNSSLSDDQKQEQMKAMREEQRKGMESILTDEQKTKWKQMREEQMKERREMKSGTDSTKQR